MVFDKKFGHIDAETLKRKKIKSQVTGCAVTALMFFASTFVISFIFEIFLIFIGGMFGLNIYAMMLSSVPFSMMYTALVSSLAIFIPSYIYLKVSETKFDDVIYTKKANASAPLYVFAASSLVLLINIPINLVVEMLGQYGVEISAPSIAVAHDPLSIISLFFAIAVIPALFEEFLFRAVILGKLRRYGDAFAIIVSGLLFGLAHGNPVSFVATFVMGMVWGFIYIKTSNIWVPVAMHFLNNALSITMTLLAESSLPQTQVELIIATIFIGVILIGVICTVFLLIRERNNLHLENNFRDLSTGEKVKATVTSLGFIAYVVFTVLLTVLLI